MKAMAYDINGIKCDADGCDYNCDDVKFEDYEQWLNKPCPKCGANLLTQEDLNTCRNLFAVAEIINAIAGDQPEGSREKIMKINMDGKGIKSIERIDSEENAA